MNNVFPAYGNDQSVFYLGYLFGSVGNVLQGIDISSGNIAPAGTTILNVVGVMFRVLNMTALSVGVLIVIYTTIMGVIATAHEGEALGKKWSGLWVPARMVFGVAALFPAKTGYSFLQILIMWVVLQGIYAADKLWTTVLNFVSITGSPYSTVSIPSIAVNPIMQNLFQALVCQAHAKQSDASLIPGGGDFYYCAANQNTDPWCQSTDLNGIEIPHGTSPTGSQSYPMGPGGACGTLTYDALPQDNTTVKWATTNAQQQALQQIVSQFNEIAKHVVADDVDYIHFFGTGNTPDQLPNSGAFLKSYCDAKGWNSNQCCFKTLTVIPGMQAVPTTCSTDPNDFPPIADGNGSYTNVSKGAMENLYWQYDLKGLLQVDPNNEGSANFITNAVNLYTGSLSAAVVNYYINTATQNNPISGWQKDASDLGWILAGGYYYKLANSSGTSQAVALPSQPIVQTSDPNLPHTSGVLKIYRTNYDAAGELTTILSQISNPNSSVASASAVAPGLSKLSDFSGAIGGSITSTFINDLTGGTSKDVLKTNPMIKIVNFGQVLMYVGDITWITFMAVMTVLLIAIGWVPFALGTGTMEPLNTATLGILWLWMPIVLAFLGFCYAFGGLLAVYVPLIPYIVFTMGALGWIIGVIEAMAAAPFIALGIISPSEQANILGRAEPALMAMLNIFLRPTLMVFGMMVSMLLASAAIALVNSAFLPVMQSIEATNTSAQSVVLPFIFMAVYVSLIVSVLNKCFSLIHLLPDSVLKWIGGAHAPGGAETGESALAGEKEKGGAMGAAAGAGAAAPLAKMKGEGEGVGQKRASRKEAKDARAEGRAEEAAAAQEEAAKGAKQAKFTPKT